LILIPDCLLCIISIRLQACPGAMSQENDPVSEIFLELGVYN